MFAEIIIPLSLPKNYTWSVPDHLLSYAKTGMRAEVVLGKNRKYAGIIKRIFADKPEAFDPKPILNILDEEAVIHVQQLSMWQWMADYYLCSEGEVLQAALPANFKLSSESIILLNEGIDFSTAELSDEEFLVTEALEIKKELRLSEVQEILDSTHVYPVIKKLIDKKICLVWEELIEKYKPKTQTYILLHQTYHNEDKLAHLLNNWSKAPKQMELLLAYLHLLKANGDVIQPDLLKKANATTAQLNGLIEKKILLQEKRVVDRIPSLTKNINIDFTLSPAQQTALEQIKNGFEQKDVCLLNGITGSGKTQIYITLMAEAIAKGEQVLYLLPEIALTAQLIRRLQKHFGGYIAIYHSKFNPNERVEIWNKVKTGETKIILGARSAVFLPFKDLSLIVVDEEHDSSYKQQDPAPRYNGRDAAIYYASLFKAKTLLGSATPSIESYHNAQLGKYSFVTLRERFGEGSLPATELVDLRTILGHEKNKIALSHQLKHAIESTVKAGKQVIIFQNRRGYSPYFICKTCGWIPHCKHCDVTLTYHKAKHQLSCHYCGTTYPVINTCVACGSNHLQQKNFGTEKMEELIAEAFPDAKVARMDYDTVKGKNEHDNLIKQFEQKRIDILVGTQMVVKGLDFENVNLVGIVDADGLLSFADFRANERAYQLMEQVSGRAGRKDADGKVMIQISNPQHPVIRHLMQHDYHSLYQSEISSRQAFQYPPFTRLILIKCKHKEKHIAEQAAHVLVNGLANEFQPYLIGPSQPVVDRVRNLYIWEVMLKLPKNNQLIQQCKKSIQQQFVIIQTNKLYRSVQLQADVDPQ